MSYEAILAAGLGGEREGRDGYHSRGGSAADGSRRRPRGGRIQAAPTNTLYVRVSRD